MKEFLLKNYTLLTHSVEVIAAFTGVVLLKKYKSKHNRYFIFFLVYVVILEFIGDYSKFVHPNRSLSFLVGTRIEKNHWLFTSGWSIGAIMFFAFYYRKILKTRIFKKIIELSSYSFLVISIIYILFNWNRFFYTFFQTISILGALVIFLCAVLYFIETLNSNKILSFYKSLDFYITSAIFIWWLIITPIDFYDVYFTYEIGNPNRDWDFMFLRWQIYLFANILMYSTFTFALIWCKPENDEY
ncbi:hypothetical protein L3X39_09320 [Sabulilitoribacter multivorans]|uniref:Uncharacterized protein n=1 Tax=Flaviramulus multivorans TaxID=1304750 RepID=A0ABS9IJT0_9FLAO|nr:hypothetical protein [Flaviramulus multivorans]MCF7560837.1 hypothetical protein [Flaviramulus multivorans]